MIRIAIVEDEKKHADIRSKTRFLFWKNTARNTTSSSWIS